MDHGKAASLTIAGDGEVERARRRIRELRLEDTVEVRDWLSESEVGELLDRAQVAAVIVGATNTAHLRSHAQVGSLRLDADDLNAIAAVTDQRRGPEGDVYLLERDRTGRHGQIMKYELNAVPAAVPPTVARVMSP